MFKTSVHCASFTNVDVSIANVFFTNENKAVTSKETVLDKCLQDKLVGQ